MRAEAYTVTQDSDHHIPTLERNDIHFYEDESV